MTPVRQILLTLAAFTGGAALLGLICYLMEFSLAWTIFDCIVGGLIAAGLIQPGVSTSRVLKTTAATIIAYNIGDLPDFEDEAGKSGND